MGLRAACGLVLSLAGPAGAQNWFQTVELLASTPSAGDELGGSISISGDTLVVGQLPDASRIGAAYVFERSAGGPGAWGEVARLQQGSPGGYFGLSVSVSGDLLAVGASAQGSGRVHVFERGFGGEPWGRIVKLAPPGSTSLFGHATCVSGNTIAVSALSAQKVFLFDRDPSGFVEVARVELLLPTSFEEFGHSLALSGDTLVVGAYNANTASTVGALAGLAPSATPGVLLASDTTEGHLTQIDGASAVGVDLSALSPTSGLAFDPLANALFGVEGGSLFRFDLATGAETTLGPTGFAAVHGLAFDPLSGTLFGVIGLGRLITLDPTGAGSTLIGDTGHAVTGLAFDPGSGTLYGSAGLLLVIDTTTAASVPVDANEPVLANGLAFDAATSTLYGVVSVPDGLLTTIDTATGVETTVGNVYQGVNQAGAAYVYERDLGGSNAWGLRAALSAADAAPADLFGYSVAIDGDTVVVGARNGDGVVADSGTAYVFERDQGGPDAFGQTAELFASAGDEVRGQFGASVTVAGDTVVVGAPRSEVARGSVHVFQRGASGWAEGPTVTPCARAPVDAFGTAVSLSGSTLAVGEPGEDLSGGLTADYGSAYVFRSAAAAPAVAYCTAGTSAAGCRATLSTCGAPSATTAFGFCLTATSVEGGQDGLFFYGTSGRQAAPWGNGTSVQCVVPPVKRGGLLAATGSAGACDGTFSQDLNARWCPACPQPTHNPGAGAVVRAQLWFRDPLNTSNRSTSLSAAVEFTLLP